MFFLFQMHFIYLSRILSYIPHLSKIWCFCKTICKSIQRRDRPFLSIFWNILTFFSLSRTSGLGFLFHDPESRIHQVKIWSLYYFLYQKNSLRTPCFYISLYIIHPRLISLFLCLSLKPKLFIAELIHETFIISLHHWIPKVCLY